MRTIGAIAAVSMPALTFSGASTPASAGNGGAVAAGVIGGLAAGAIIGSAAANANRGYYGGPAYVEPVYGPPPRCWIERRDYVDPYGNIRVRNVRVCN